MPMVNQGGIHGTDCQIHAEELNDELDLLEQGYVIKPKIKLSRFDSIGSPSNGFCCSCGSA